MSGAARRRILEAMERVTRTLEGTRAAAAGLLLDQCRIDGGPPVRTRREQEALAAVGEREGERLARLVEALRRLDEGRYGTCALCDAPIEEERLALLPDTDRCAECAT